MLGFLARRLALVAPTLFAISLILFALMHLIPGDPLQTLLPADASEADRRAVSAALGLDAPLPAQYAKWVSRVVQGDLGTSISRRRPVTQLLGEAIVNTLLLAACAATVAFTIAVVAGVLMATVPLFARGRPLDRLLGVLLIGGVSVPPYWVAMVLVILFSVQWRLLPSSGMTTVGGDGSLGDLLAHLLLPTIAAALVPMSVVARMVRTSVTEILSQDFVMTLRAQGLPARHVTTAVLKNATPSILTVAGLQIGYLLGGSVLIETIFSWPGVGSLIYGAIGKRDYPVIQGAVLMVSTIFILLNVAVDVLQTRVDPRLRHG